MSKGTVRGGGDNLIKQDGSWMVLRRFGSRRFYLCLNLGVTNVMFGKYRSCLLGCGPPASMHTTYFILKIVCGNTLGTLVQENLQEGFGRDERLFFLMLCFQVEYPLSSLPLNETATFIQLVQPMASERERYNEIVASALAEGKSRGRRRSLHPMNPEPAPLTTPEPEKESENRLTAAESPQKERSQSLLPGLGKVFKKKAWANRTQVVADVDNVPAIPDITNLWSSTEEDLDDVVVSDGPRLPAVQATSIKRTFRSVRSFIEMCEDETLRATNEAFTNIQEQDQKQGMTLLQMSVKSYEPEPELLLQKSRGPAVRGAKKATEPRLVFRKALYDELKEHEKPLYVLRSMMVAEGEYSDTQEYTVRFGAGLSLFNMTMI